MNNQGSSQPSQPNLDVGMKEQPVEPSIFRPLLLPPTGGPINGTGRLPTDLNVYSLNDYRDWTHQLTGPAEYAFFLARRGGIRLLPIVSEREKVPCETKSGPPTQESSERKDASTVFLRPNSQRKRSGQKEHSSYPSFFDVSQGEHSRLPCQKNMLASTPYHTRY